MLYVPYSNLKIEKKKKTHTHTQKKEESKIIQIDLC